MHRTVDHGRPGWRAVAVTAWACLLLAGCTSTTLVNRYRHTATHIGSRDSVVVLGRRYRSEYETEYDFIDCVEAELGGGRDSLRVIPEKTFVDTMYPYFETSTAPTDVKQLPRLVRKPLVARKLSELHVRYLVWIDGFTETLDKYGSISCFVAPPAAGCFGLISWDDEAGYEAAIWDLKSLRLAGKISVETEGTSSILAIGLPVPLLARVQSDSCQHMAEQIRAVLR